MTVPVAISLATHALGLLLLLIGGRFAWPAAPVAVELMPVRQHAARPPQAPRAEPTPPQGIGKPTHKKEGAGAKAAEKPKPVEPPPPPTSDLKPFAPDDANLVLLVRADKLHKSPYGKDVEYLLSALPDYGTLLGGSGLGLEDFEALLIATGNPRDVTATFIAARYKDSEKIRAIGSRPLSPGDPRQFRFLQPGLAVLARPDSAARLDGAQADGGADSAQARWLAQLAQLDRVASAEGGPTVLGTLSDAPALFRLGDGFPTPLALAVAVTADASPAVHVKGVFADEAAAALMERRLPEILGRYRSLTALLGLSSALDGLKATRKGADLDIEGRIPEAQFRLALSWARAAVPHAATVEAVPPETPPAQPSAPPPAQPSAPTPAPTPDAPQPSPAPHAAPSEAAHGTPPAIDAGATPR